MALINCPECNAQVSDTAAACIKCGYPLEQARAKFSELGASATQSEQASGKQVDGNTKENGGIAEIRFEKRKVGKFSAVGCGIGLVIVAFVAFGFILSATIFGKIVGVVVLIFCLTVVAVGVWGFTRGNDPLVIGEDYVAFEGKKIFARDVASVEVKNEDKNKDTTYLVCISTTYGTEIINLVGYGIKPDRLGEVADIIAESLKTRIRP